MRLKEIRESRGLSQRQAALGLNLSPQVYNRYENGLREPSNALLLVIANFFGVTVDELLGREGADQNSSESKIQTSEARILAHGIDKMPKAERERALDAMKLIFTDYAPYFEKAEEGNDDHDNADSQP